MSAKTITDASFAADVLDSGDVVLIDFWAEWCGPCKQIAPALDEIAKDYEGRLTIGKVNIDENPETPGKYGVRGIPTLMIFSGGEHIATRVGAAPKSQLAAWVEEVLKEAAA
jgi:thioredoxin 1